MSKPMGVTLPFVLLLLDYWPLGRIAGIVPDGNVATRKFPSAPSSRVLWEKVPLLLMAAGSAAMTLRYGGGTTWIGSLGEYPLWVRAANTVVSYSTYIWKTVWPVKLAVYYPHPGGDIPMWKVAAGSLFLVGVTFIAVRFGKRRPYLPVGWFFYIGTLVPVIGLVQVGEQAMADRYSYLPLIGVFLMMAWGAAETVKKTCAVLPLIIMASLILLALATVARHQTLYWSNSIRLLRHTLDAAPEKNWVAHFSLGYELDELGRKEEAITEYERALAIQPKSADLHNNLGLILKEKGKYEEAAAHFLDAANLRRNHFDSRYNLAETFFQQSRFHEAVPWYQDALRIRPDDLDAHNRLGISLAKLGKIDEAIVHFQEMLRLSPGDARALKNIGIALEKRRRGNPSGNP
jgi:Flp pilus assembly protein TadD